MRGLDLQAGEPCLLRALPSIGEPGGEIAHGDGRQVGQQLREVELRIDAMAAASRGEAGQDGRGAAAAWVADEKAVFPV